MSCSVIVFAIIRRRERAMSTGTSFIVLLLCTVASLGAAVFMGITRRVRVHIPLVLLTLVFLGLTIWQALALGARYDLEGTGAIYPVHRLIARVTTFSLLLPLGAGVAALLNRSRETLHRRLAWIALALVVVTAITGVVLIWRAEPLP
jgi:hypothetical protein